MKDTIVNLTKAFIGESQALFLGHAENVGTYMRG
jgi:rubrerythrin